MNRRKALWLSLISGGLLPSALLGQEPGSRSRTDDLGDLDLGDDPPPSRSRPPARRTSDDDDIPSDLLDDEPSSRKRAPDDEPLGAEMPPENFRDEPGQAWKNFDIARYTSLAYKPENPTPQNAILEWVFRRTGSAVWHGDKVAVLSAGKAQLRAYHSPRVLKQVEEMVKRFTDSQTDLLQVRARFVAAQDTRWRYSIFSRLNRIGTGPQGQQLWLVSKDDAQLVRSQLLAYPGFKGLADQTIKLVNGQTFTMDTSDDKQEYVVGPRRDSAVGYGFQPSFQALKEGVTLRFSPLLTYDGDALEAAIDLQVTTIRRLVKTKILTRREVGPGDMPIDVPEVSTTRLNVPIKNWPLGQTLIISGGICPGILQSKTGFLNLRVPGTVPTDTEMLAFIEVEPLRAPAPARAARRSRDEFDDNGDDLLDRR